MVYIKKCLVFIFIFSSIFGFCQTVEDFSINQEEIDESSLIQLEETRLALLQKPLKINKAGYVELVESGLFNPTQAYAIIKHRSTFGPFLSAYELQQIELLSANKIRTITPYLAIQTSVKNQINQHLQYQKHRLIFSLKHAPTVSTFHPSSVQKRIKFGANNGQTWRYGFIAENDAGELFKNQSWSNLKFDYLGFYLFMKPKHIIDVVAIGDFHVSLGQGLTINTGRKPLQSIFIASMKLSTNSIKPNKTFNENGGMRGLALQKKWGHLHLTSFCSLKKIDGQPSKSKEIAFSSFSLDEGLHVTESQIRNRKNLKSLVIGNQLCYKNDHLKLGLHLVSRQFSKPIMQREPLYLNHRFNGRGYHQVGISWDGHWGSNNIYGESVVENKNHLSALGGWYRCLGNHNVVHVNLRYYSPRHLYYHTNSLSSTSTPVGEKGLTTSWRHLHSKKTSTALLIDQFETLWPRYLQRNMQWNQSIMGQFETTKSSQKVIIRIGAHQYTSTNDPVMNLNRRYVFRFHHQIDVSKRFRFRWRLESNKSKTTESTWGHIIYADLRLTTNFGFQIQMRQTFSSIPDFQNRIYTFENTPTYQYPMGVYTKSGLSNRLLLKYKIKRKHVFWLMYSWSTVNHFEEQELNGLKRQGIFQYELTF